MSVPDRALPSTLALAALLGLAPAAQAQQGAGAARAQHIAAQGTSAGVPACATCHGASGEGGPAFPYLAGTGAAYLRAQLDAFADGSRANLIMQPIAKGLTPEDRQALALYYSRLKAPAATPVARADATPGDAGAWLAARGRWSDGLPACAQCHGPGGQGVGEHFPPLAGLPAQYIADQLRSWRANTRPPGPLKLMVAVAAKLTDADIQAVSAHYAALGPQQAGSTAPTPAGRDAQPAASAASGKAGDKP